MGRATPRLFSALKRIRIDLEGLVIILNRFIKPALGGEGIAQIVQRLEKVRIDLDGLAIVLDRFIKPALGGEGDPQIVQRVGEFGLIWMAL